MITITQIQQESWCTKIFQDYCGMLIIGNINNHLLPSLSPGSLSLFANELLFPPLKTEENTEDIYQKEREVRIKLTAVRKQSK